MSTIEKDWITKSGLRAVVLIVAWGGRQRHRCGYVAMPPGHPMHGASYGEPHPLLTQDEADHSTIGKKSPILALTAAVRGDEDGERVRRSPDVVFDCHGGITFSGGNKGYPVESDCWWFGFDCAHCDDGEIEEDPRWPRRGEVRTLEYVEAECERLAGQIVARFPFPVPA